MEIKSLLLVTLDKPYLYLWALIITKMKVNDILKHLLKSLKF